VAITPGQNLLHYRLIEKIGEGGMGVVWKAEDTKLHRHVALKVLPEAMAADPERRARFEREARAVAGLNHPNIVTLHSVEETDTSTGSVHFITMELVEGRTLTQLLPTEGFTLSRMLEIAIPLAEAVSSAHRAGITHRDLKPQNVMIGADGRVKVLDFGLAKLAAPSSDVPFDSRLTTETLTQEGVISGTVPYMSPEQVRGSAVDPRSDIFSLGVMLYEMAAGHRPFAGDNAIVLLASILKDDPPTVEGMPASLNQVLRKCLAKEPEDRYQDGAALLAELAGVRGEEALATALAPAPVASDAEPVPDVKKPKKRRSKRRKAELEQLAGESPEAARRVLDVMREEEAQQHRKRVEGLKLVGLITIAGGIGAMGFLYLLLKSEADRPVWVVGLVPIVVGIVMLLYGVVARPKDG
jgi:serine/threonine protein kinase